MNKLIMVVFVFLLAACAIEQRYYTQSNLNNISLGDTKNKLLSMFSGSKKVGSPPPMQIRAAQKSNNKLIEVGEVWLTNGVSSTVPYWLLFENGALVQWGRPEDWKAVQGRYQISYTPSVSY